MKLPSKKRHGMDCGVLWGSSVETVAVFWVVPVGTKQDSVQAIIIFVSVRRDGSHRVC